MSDISELATIRNKPVIHAGTHKSRNAGDFVVTEDEIDSIIEGSNVLKELIKESMTTGVYRGNNVQKGFIPGPINLFHNDVLDETMKERTKGIDWKWSKVMKDGKAWAAATYTDVPPDVAKSLKKEWPIVSAEVLSLTDPDTGKHYPKVIRSTAFLDRFTPPAVKGQTDDVQIELAEGESSITVLYSTTTTEENTEEDKRMDEKEKLIAELQAEKEANAARIVELEAAQEKAESARIAELEAGREADRKQLAELQAAQDANETKAIVAEFSQKTFTGQGTRWSMSKAFTDVVNPLLTATKKTDVIEMSEGSKPTRDALKDVLTKVAEMAAEGSMLVPITEMGGMNHEPDGEAKATLDSEVARLMKETPEKGYQAAFAEAAVNTGFFEGENK